MSTTLILGVEEGTIHKEAEVEGTTTISTLHISTLHSPIHLLKVSPLFHNILRTSQRILGLNAKSVESLDIKHWTTITGWTLPIKADIHLQN